jgi:hypothetical protein
MFMVVIHLGFLVGLGKIASGELTSQLDGNAVYAFAMTVL